MILNELYKLFSDELKSIYPQEEIQSLFWTMSKFYIGVTRFENAINPTQIIEASNEIKMLNGLKRLKSSEPIQYIIGQAYFLNREFRVSPSTLIPRPETEDLVRWVVEDFKNEKIRVLDIGTGSGCIAISLSKMILDAEVVAIDVSEDALQIAKQNAEKLNAEIVFKHKDVLSLTTLDPVDVIVSNPPYVRNLEKEEMRENVLKYEPSTALFVPDNDPLLFYRKIAKLAIKALSSKGALYFEINQYLSKQLLDMLYSVGFVSCELREDIFGKPRMIKCKMYE